MEVEWIKTGHKQVEEEKGAVNRTLFTYVVIAAPL